jgi:hypothetical protein
MLPCCLGLFTSAWHGYSAQRLLGVGLGRLQSQQQRGLAVVCCSTKQQQQQQRRYILPPVYLNRSDLAWGSPPFRFHQTCFLEDLELHRQIPALTRGAGAEDVAVKFLVDSPSHGARGLWLKVGCNAMP